VLRVHLNMRIIPVGTDYESVNSLSIGTLAREIKPDPPNRLETGARYLLSIGWLRDIRYVFRILVSFGRAHTVWC
jgi:hypothetical protein